MDPSGIAVDLQNFLAIRYPSGYDGIHKGIYTFVAGLFSQKNHSSVIVLEDQAETGRYRSNCGQGEPVKFQDILLKWGVGMRTVRPVDAAHEKYSIAALLTSSQNHLRTLQCRPPLCTGRSVLLSPQWE